ncbi:hypothetical protein Taro_040240 [Colocasia esculenta]|uniref:Chalcone-flavonone isomerase family protein n=1 Tax=Colocasia esculenta TaxID=4460 RepID=A0A843W8G5_COLES|nr:hypothetical protein [Colocasia esculenta]
MLLIVPCVNVPICCKVRTCPEGRRCSSSGAPRRLPVLAAALPEAREEKMVLGAVLWSAVPPSPRCLPEGIHRPSYSCCAAGASPTHLALPRGSPVEVAAASSSSSVLPCRSGYCGPAVVLPKRRRAKCVRVVPRASVGSAEYTVEPATNMKFQKDQQVPGCSTLLSLLGTGYREKVFAIIGVKVYAAGFYVDPSIAETLHEWKGRPATEILDDPSLFKSIFQDCKMKSLQIDLVRDVDGQTFWNALNDVISPRIKEPSSTDGTALSTFRSTFEGRPLKQGTTILLSWVEPSKILVSISSEGFPSTIDAEIQSMNVTFALFDAFFGPSPVSPTLKTSIANGLMMLLNH